MSIFIQYPIIQIYFQHIHMAVTQINHVAGKNRWVAHLFLILFFQSVFFGSIFICLFAIVTLNFQLMLGLALFSLVQRFAKRSQTVIDLVNKYIVPKDYFRTFKRIYEQQIPDNQPSLFCLHPHSVLSYCIVANMNADNSKMSNYTGLASRFLLSLPFIGLQLRLWGVQSVNPHNITRLMKQKKSIGLVPGGFEQASLTTPNEMRIFIKHRKGFLKYALKHNYTIYPTLTYNEHKAFKTLDMWKKARLWLNKLKIPGVIFGGGFLWLYLPLNVDLITIVGKGIKRKPEHMGQSTIGHNELDIIHTQYMNQLQRLHDKYREQYGQAPLVFY